MNFYRKSLFVALSALIAAPSAWAVDFVHEVVPVLKKHCVECHGGDKAKGGFSINTREFFLEDKMGTPGNAAASTFLQLIQSDDTDEQMPPEKKPRVPAESIAILKAWVNEGMKWEPGFSFDISNYEPPLKPRRPELPEATGNRSHPIDRIIDQTLKKSGSKLLPSASDDVFLRRAYLDLIGLLPTPNEREDFIKDASKDKRSKLVESLLSRDVPYADHWLTFWNDLLRNDYTGTGFITGGRRQISAWLYESLITNKPFDQFVKELIAPPSNESTGFIDGIKWRGEVSAGQTVEIQFAQSVSQALLGINLKCASCHDSFIDRWKLDESYGLAAIYSERPLEIHRCDKPVGRTAKASWLFPEIGNVNPTAPREQRLKQLAGLMVHPDNGRTPRTIANRLWAQLMGRGIVHPLDAMQTEPWNADLLDYLATYLSDHDHDLKALLKHIATSQAYQAVSEKRTKSEEGKYNYRGPRARRLTAEQFVDALWQITGRGPSSFDAPIFRGKPSDEKNQIKLSAKWIWGPSANPGNVPPAGETILLKKTITLEHEVLGGGAVVTCDNEFVLYINGREITRGNNWTQPQTVALNGRLKKGANHIVVKVVNAGKTPNPAGLLFEGRVKLSDGNLITLASGADWRWSAKVPKGREGRLGAMPKDWKVATVVPALGAWNDGVGNRFRSLLAVAASDDSPMIRASLMKSDFLMRSLGRPMREQIVSSRPAEVSTLEAIDLYNNESLTRYLKEGAADLAEREWKNADELIQHVMQFALTRSPSKKEAKLMKSYLGENAGQDKIQDLLWSIVMMPEFMIIR